MSEPQEIKIADIVIDEEIYPRKQEVWLVAFQYSQAMKAGAVFPPIILGKYKKKLYLVDGRHRINANKILKHDSIQAITKEYSNKKAMFIDAVKFNNIHGKALTLDDKTKIFGTLKNWKMPDLEISSLLNTPVPNFDVFTRRLVSSEGKQETIRSSVEDALTTGRITEKAAYGITQTENQNKFVNRTAMQALTNVISLFENKIVPLDDPATKELCVKLLTILQTALSTTEGVTAS